MRRDLVGQIALRVELLAFDNPDPAMEGDSNGAPQPEPESYAGKFSGRYAHRLVTGGIGHNLAQEAPQAFAQAVLDAASYAPRR